MRARDLDRYCSIPYSSDGFDCADLVVLVQRELFHREVQLPQQRPRRKDGQLVLAGHSEVYGTKTDQLQDGLLVLMRSMGVKDTWHVGVLFILDGEPHVLHTTRRNGFSQVNAFRELPMHGIRLEGVYEWKAQSAG